VKSLHAPMAGAGGSVAVPEPLTVIFDIPPDPHQDHRDARAEYAADAATLIFELERACPGGFMDALFAGLCARQVGVLQVPNVRIIGERSLLPSFKDFERFYLYRVEDRGPQRKGELAANLLGLLRPQLYQRMLNYEGGAIDPAATDDNLPRFWSWCRHFWSDQ
jgi:hypothetical protein